jgi:hypothetical protein
VSEDKAKRKANWAFHPIGRVALCLPAAYSCGRPRPARRSLAGLPFCFRLRCAGARALSRNVVRDLQKTRARGVGRKVERRARRASSRSASTFDPRRDQGDCGGRQGPLAAYSFDRHLHGLAGLKASWAALDRRRPPASRHDEPAASLSRLSWVGSGLPDKPFGLASAACRAVKRAFKNAARIGSCRLGERPEAENLGRHSGNGPSGTSKKQGKANSKELRIDRARVRERKGPAPSVLLCPLDNMTQIGLQMHDRLLAAPIGKFGMVCAVNHKQHNRTRTKIERDISAYVRTLMAGNGKAETALLDAAHADHGAALALRHNRI